MLDLRMYVVTQGMGRATVQAAVAAARAGAGVVQVRAKKATDAELLQFALTVAGGIRDAAPGTRVLVDDRPDVAWAARRLGAHVHGVHLGPEDLPVQHVRALLGSDAVIGFTANTMAQVQDAQRLAGLVDFLGTGPFRPTPTRDYGRPPLGADGYRPIVAASRIPVVAIGGITPYDVPELRGTGVAGVAMVRGIMEAAEPGAVVSDVLRRWDAAPDRGSQGH